MTGLLLIRPSIEVSLLICFSFSSGLWGFVTLDLKGMGGESQKQDWDESKSLNHPVLPKRKVSLTYILLS
jgi:hypothetical protein